MFSFNHREPKGPNASNGPSQTRRILEALVIILLSPFYFLTGVSPRRIARCPGDDRILAVKLGALQLWTASLMAASVAMALHVGAHLGLDQWPAMIGAAVLVSGIILLVDATIIQSDWYRQGMAQFRARGSIAGASLQKTASWLLGLGARLVLSAAVALILAHFTELWLYRGDVDAELLRRYQVRNVRVLHEATLRIDNLMAARSQEQQDAANEREAIEKRLQEARDSVPDTYLVDTEIEHSEDEIKTADQQLDAARAEEYRRSQDKVHERNGTAEAPYHPSLPGPGYLFRTARDLAKQAHAEAERLTGVRQDLETHLEARRRDRQRIIDAATKERDAAVLTLGTAEMAATAKESKVKESLDSLRQNREAEIERVAAALPEYVPKETGLLAQVDALDALRGQSAAVWQFSVGLKLLLALLDLSAVATKIFFSPVSRYALRTASEFEAAATEDGADLQASGAALRADELRQLLVILDLETQIEEKRQHLHRIQAVHRTLAGEDEPPGFRWPTAEDEEGRNFSDAAE